MTSFADCLDLLPDDLTEGQLENFLDHAARGPILPAAMESLRHLVRDARGADPSSSVQQTIAVWASAAFRLDQKEGCSEFVQWARDQKTIVIRSARRLTTPVTLQLSTPTALRIGLRLLGLHWSPQAYDKAALVAQDGDTEPGLYCWVTAGLQPNPRDPLDGGILYIGIGDGHSGWRKRLREEWGWIGAEADHGHGMAMHRTSANVVGGRVSYVKRPTTWLNQVLIDANRRGIPLVDSYLDGIATGDRLTPTRAAESIAIRLAIHLGDTGAPVNAAGAGAWASNRPEDWAGFAAARFMATRMQMREPLPMRSVP